jgi:hypothetical protein
MATTTASALRWGASALARWRPASARSRNLIDLRVSPPRKTVSPRKGLDP